MDEQIKRLQTVTDRLEAVARQLGTNSSQTSGPSIGDDESANNISRLPVIQDYEALINDAVKPFLATSQKIGGDLSKMSEHVSLLFQAQQQFIRQAVQSKKPNDHQLVDAVKPQSSEIEAITAFTNKNRKSPLFNHLSAISEGIPALGWILVSPTPGPHIKDMSDAAQFYSNRVLKEFKEKDPTHAEWVKLWAKVLNDLYSYVRKYHTTGLAWASQGKRDFSTVSTPTIKPVTATAGGPPPPAPPPPPPPMALNLNTNTEADNSRNELMSSINSLGQGVTARLKKVPDELKTHKNPQLRQQAGNQLADNDKPAVPPRGKKPTTTSTEATTTKGTPKLALEGNKWIVEHQTNQSNLRVTQTEMKHCVYIYRCTNCTITIEGKVNSIVLDQCTKVGVQFTSVVSLIEFVNCKSMKAQVIEQVPTIQIEKTDGCHVYLSPTSLDTEFITSKSSEMSINIPTSDGEYREYPIAEQFKTCIQGGKRLVTTPNESAGV
ncbi:unnamed protein product [Adineta ricciae]|uniref:C-CAP/cofactor C-like domain-containing protein n=1 Tax=Adineta ricciae TaxID=249248 RepID=A0A814C497_ADIRI|nr:unnamed protein product [Adineta ricciae]